MQDPYASWGLYPKLPQKAVRPAWREDGLPAIDGDLLPRGNGRSYGDSCLANGGTLVDLRRLDHFISFDPATGRLACEAGVLLRDILRLTVPHGWFLAVAPGTQLVTVGGAIANDVHGKNHHRRGSFGNHVREIELLRSSGERILCAPHRDSEWFHATIGGLGLTGAIVRAELQLVPVAGADLDVETIRFGRLDEFFGIAAESDRSHDYTVAWIDCHASGASLGRGVFERANHTSEPGRASPPPASRRIPFTPPISMVNRLTSSAFNAARYRLAGGRRRRRQHFQSFLYPLDGLLEWNRLFGPSGFLQFQCAVPTEAAQATIGAILELVSAAGTGSPLAVLKTFGTERSLGLLSFPLPGVTLALDFPFRGPPTLDLLGRLHRLVGEAGGRVYPAKDACMPGEIFRRAYPDWTKLEARRDPRVMSAFWKRVTSGAPAHP